ncbi:TetR/AcrR family transcriptional regulator [Kutzneria viridogrisea]|uniref:HTH tetR-type domain-containing protein n=2 Tax=Kutzneria TaxID=43356 RepID=W5WAT2_9PSEU|nr:TetR family transcriptional regulator C-terminal domain-containing protein [Kutzneria albida]AHH98042.1 hypothetical protein KALB_4680 [Kutzneria albida DSM 43870]MBA8924299.1 AcrR family transcriptional regulator [Kutzneria viridogrisea]
MPRQIDHEARRSQIAEAVCALIAERGVEAATLREVAARAEVSMGAVQRAFPKDGGMLRFALDHLIAEVEQRGTERIAGSSSARVLLTVTLQEMALAGTDQGAQARVWLAFLAHAGVRQEFAAVLREHHAKALDLLVWIIDHGRRTGEIRAGLNSRLEARTLHAVVDGLTQQVVIGTVTAEDVHQLLDHAVKPLWT